MLFLTQGFGDMVVTAGADTAGAPATVTATVTRTGQMNVAPNGPLINLVDGDSVVLTATGNPAPFFGFLARICKPGVEIEQQSDFNPTQGGNCIGVPFAGGAADDQFKEASAAPGNTTATTTFRVGAGSQLDASGQGTTITCGPDNPCALWLKLSVPPEFNGGAAWVHYDLQYATTTTVAPTTTTTVAPTTTTTTAPTTTTTVPRTTTTTSTGGTTTTTTGGSTTTTSATSSTTVSQGATTTTTVGPLSATPSSLAAGDTLNVTTTGWKAETSLKAVLNSDPVDLGTLSVDASGKATKALTVPANVPVGTHTLKVTGTGADGVARELNTQINVIARSTPLARSGASVWHLLWNSTALVIAGCLLVVAAVRRGRVSP